MKIGFDLQIFIRDTKVDRVSKISKEISRQIKEVLAAFDVVEHELFVFYLEENNHINVLNEKRKFLKA